MYVHLLPLSSARLERTPHSSKWRRKNDAFIPFLTASWAPSLLSHYQTGTLPRRGRLRTLESVPSLLVVVKANPKDARERERERHARGVKEKTR